MNDWIHGSKIKSNDLSELGLREKGRLHDESRYVLLTEKTLSDLIIGIKEMFKDATVTVLYHIFKRAGRRKTESLLEDMKSYRVKEGRIPYSDREARDIVLTEALNEFEAEGYCQKFEVKIEHANKRVLLKVRRPLAFRLKRLVEKSGIRMTSGELSAVSRGVIAGVFSALTNSDIDVKNAIIDEKGEEITYILPEEVYDKLIR